jgi:putative aldouronate transport system substrate-binding protein
MGVKYPAEMHSEPILRPDCFPVWSMSLEDGSAAAIANNKITDVTTKYYSRLILAEDDAAYDALWEEFLNEYHAIDLDSYKAEIDRQIAQRMGQ